MYQSKVVTVTPEMAREWLSRTPPHQRKVSRAHVDRLASDMAAGLFVSSPQPFIFDDHGALADGRHRAEAIAQSGITLRDCVVVYGMPSGMFGFIDVGRRRTPAQVLESSHGSLLTAAARLVAMYADNPAMPNISGGGRGYRHTIPEIVGIVESTPTLVDLVPGVERVYRQTRINGPSLLAITTMGLPGTDQWIVSEWLEGLATGSNLSADDPRLALRQVYSNSSELLNNAPGRRRGWAYIVKSWNAHVCNKPIRQLKLLTREDMPRIKGAA